MLLNLAYFMAIALLAPWLAWRALRTGRYRADLRAKLTGRLRLPASGSPTVWFHGVSVGEIHLLATLVAEFRRQHPHVRVVVSSTTDTGLAEARKRFETVSPWPLDFTWAVANALDAVKPCLLVLAESELWPNMLRAAEHRGVPVAVVNARLSPRSARRYARIAGLAQKLMFNRVSLVAAQSESVAARFRSLGVPGEKLAITGSIKYDGAAQPVVNSPLHAMLKPAQPPGSLLWVAGSTHAPEERIVLAAFAKLHQRVPHLHLLLVPRHPDRFDEVAALLESTGLRWQRRSKCTAPIESWPPVLLLDTVGELAAAWSLADVGYVGGTLDGKRGGQSMIEPAGCGVPTVFGPHVWNFADAARQLVEAGAAVMIQQPDELAAAMADLLGDAARRECMGQAAREFVAAQQGAAARTVDALTKLLPPAAARRAA